MLDLLQSLDPRTALAIHAAATVVTIAAVLVVARLARAGGVAPGWGVYESGAPAAEATTLPVSTQYFQIAAFFVIFDLEAAFLFTWALAAREAGGAGLVSATIFIGVLLAALAYLRLDGALDVGARSRGGAPLEARA